MAQLNEDDLAQMNEGYFKSLDQKRLVQVAKNLHLLAVEQWEKINSDSSNTNQPPSLDNPFEKKKKAAQKRETKSPQLKRKPGRQKGSKGFGRSQILKVDEIIPHYPNHCSACNQVSMEYDPKPYMAHQVLELERTGLELKIVCQLHHYYQGSCSCGHQSKSKPGEGITSKIEGRTRDLKLTEYVLVGNVFATLIASMGVRYRLSRAKIEEFLFDWLGVKLSIGTIDRCIREAGIACEPVVEELLAELQLSEILHVDETPWYQKGKLYWLWVAINSKTAVFRIAPRTKKEFKQLVTEAFVGWLITDGYNAYRHRERRQRCLAHLIRKAIRISESIYSRIARIGRLILGNLRDFIHAIKEGKNRAELDQIICSLRGICYVGKNANQVRYKKLKALASEILNDWDAVIAAVNNPNLPLTNNEAERALRHAVIARRISYGTRTNEGSIAYSSLLSVIETCRLRQVNPWEYISSVLKLARKGLSPPKFPVAA